MIVERRQYGRRGEGSLVRYHNSAFWVSCYSVEGQEFRESTRCRDLKDARRWHKAKLVEITKADGVASKVMTPSKQKVTLSDLLDELEASPGFKGL